MQEYGNILLGVSYLPTAQRLTINVMKLRNIKFTPPVPSVNEFSKYSQYNDKRNNFLPNVISILNYTNGRLQIVFLHEISRKLSLFKWVLLFLTTKFVIADPYVRVLMLNGKTGRRIKKKKTKCIPATAEPEFNETLTFDLPITQIDTLQFLIILCSKVKSI